MAASAKVTELCKRLGDYVPKRHLINAMKEIDSDADSENGSEHTETADAASVPNAFAVCPIVCPHILPPQPFQPAAVEQRGGGGGAGEEHG